MSRSNRFLVVVRAGDQSLHPQWTRTLATRDWDLVVSYFGDDPHRFRDAGETRIDDKGLKWQGLHALLTRDGFWRRYDYVWFPDDDLAADQATISAFFAHVVELKLSLAQPALSWTSHYSHPVTIQLPGFRVRWTNFIEIMAPCFERGFLETCLPTFAENLSGWGLDWVWPHRLGVETRRSAVIDAVAVTHTRPVGGPSRRKLREVRHLRRCGRQGPRRAADARLERIPCRAATSGDAARRGGNAVHAPGCAEAAAPVGRSTRGDTMVAEATNQTTMVGGNARSTMWR